MPEQLTISFELVGDNFAQAWYFNRFRIDKLGTSFQVTLALVSDEGAAPFTNAFVMSRADVLVNKSRSLEYLAAVNPEFDSGVAHGFGLKYSNPPSRIYPVNFLNLSRMEEDAELSLYRFSMHTALNRQSPSKAPAKKAPIPCYPVVMFRCSIRVQVALLKDLFDEV